MSPLSNLVGATTKVAKTAKKKKPASTPQQQKSAARTDIAAKRQAKTDKRNAQAKMKIGEQMGRQQEAYAKASKKPAKPKSIKPSEAKNMGELLRSKPKKSARSMYNAARGNSNPMRNYMNRKKK